VFAFVFGVGTATWPQGVSPRAGTEFFGAQPVHQVRTDVRPGPTASRRRSGRQRPCNQATRGHSESGKGHAQRRTILPARRATGKAWGTWSDAQGPCEGAEGDGAGHGNAGRGARGQHGGAGAARQRGTAARGQHGSAGRRRGARHSTAVRQARQGARQARQGARQARQGARQARQGARQASQGARQAGQGEAVTQGGVRRSHSDDLLETPQPANFGRVVHRFPLPLPSPCPT
jgi:hypothetical protein